MTQPEPELGSPVPRRRSEEINRRARIYAWRMLLRFVCFGLVVVVPGWWKLVFVVGAVVLPYVAVVDANQRSAPDAGRRAPRDNGPALTGAKPAAQLAAPKTVIDGETTESAAQSPDNAGAADR
ncbi:DUF3099 domain-containing protein [Dermabacteraceae bacterium TAE3-ERU27]|nr:DUF3099 domain-containing protein [Dermabacteraceae bacterium TAE3-ERU27]